MFTVFHWLVRIVTAVLLAALLAVSLGYYFAAGSLPDYDARYEVEGLSAPLEIVRTTENVPHLFGANDADVFFGLGLAHAQDRLWQMVLLRRTVQGRLSEVFGPATAKSDELMRRLDLYGLATRDVAAQSPQAQAALSAYARGVNEWIGLVNAGAMGRGAPEFFVFSNEISYWSPADSLAILKLMALRAEDGLAREIARARVARLSPDWARDLLPEVPGSGAMALPDYAALFGAPIDTRLAARAPEGPFYPVPQRPGAGGASNAFAAAPARSAAGGSLLANDPHTPLEAPAPFYLARLELASGGVIGATVPGVPLVLSGRNTKIGWGIATTGADTEDLVMEALDPADPARYLRAGGSEPFETRRSILRIEGAAPVTLTLRWSAAGPILPGGHLGLAEITPRGHVAALEWTGLQPGDTSFSAGLALMTAATRAEAESAARAHVAPVTDLVIADERGVGMIVAGALPARDKAHPTQGRLPAPGTDPAALWAGRLPPETNPRDLAPAGGIVAATNNKLGAWPFPRHVTFDWPDSQRIQRLTRLMGEREIHTRESFIAAQLDIVSPAARGLLPLIGADLWFTGAPAAEGTPERRRQRALDLLAQWDGEMNEHLPEPLIYAAWLDALQQRLIQDELGPLAADFAAPDPLFLERVFRNVEGAGRWCDVMQSAPVETCTDIARMALDAALIDLSARFGPSVESWRWGDAHEARQDHSALGRVPGLGWVTNIRQSLSGGDFTLARARMAHQGPAPFAAVDGASYRGVYDLADPDSSVFVISTGQSGHPLSRHYDDMAELWRRGEYVPMSLDPALARAAAAGITRLVPKGAAAD